MIKNGDMVRIISNGNGYETKVLDAKGKMIPMVYRASWECEVCGKAKVTLWIRTGKYYTETEIMQCFGTIEAQGIADIVPDTVENPATMYVKRDEGAV